MPGLIPSWRGAALEFGEVFFVEIRIGSTDEEGGAFGDVFKKVGGGAGVFQRIDEYAVGEISRCRTHFIEAGENFFSGFSVIDFDSPKAVFPRHGAEVDLKFEIGRCALVSCFFRGNYRGEQACLFQGLDRFISNSGGKKFHLIQSRLRYG